MPIRPVYLPLFTLGVTAAFFNQPRPVVAQIAPAPVSADAAAPQSADAGRYDVKAEALLKKSADTLLAARTFSGQTVEIRRQPAQRTMPALETRHLKTFSLQKPNLVFQNEFVQNNKGGGIIETPSTPWRKYRSDGKTGAITYADDKTYQKRDVASETFATGFSLNFHEFFLPTRSDWASVRTARTNGSLHSLRLLPDETWAGVPCAVVEKAVTVGKTKSGAPVYRTTTIYVGKDNIVRGYHIETPIVGGSEGSVQTTDVMLTGVVLDAPVPASRFAVDVTGFTEYVEPTRPELLAAGSPAPDFTAYDKNGKAVKLSDLKGKIVVLDFWATWCGPCMASLPHTTEIAKKSADKGVVVLAVNVWDTKEAFDKWLPAHPEYAALQFVIDTTQGQGQDVATKQYKVSGIPTQYVIDRTGKIVTSFVGFGGPTDDLENAIAKADAPQKPVAQR